MLFMMGIITSSACTPRSPKPKMMKKNFTYLYNIPKTTCTPYPCLRPWHRCVFDCVFCCLKLCLCFGDCCCVFVEFISSGSGCCCFLGSGFGCCFFESCLCFGDGFGYFFRGHILEVQSLLLLRRLRRCTAPSVPLTWSMNCCIYFWTFLGIELAVHFGSRRWLDIATCGCPRPPPHCRPRPPAWPPPGRVCYGESAHGVFEWFRRTGSQPARSLPQ